MVLRIGFLVIFAVLSGISFGVINPSSAKATEILPRYIYTNSALIIEVRQLDDPHEVIQKFGGFPRNYKIGPYMEPIYLETRKLVHGQRYTGFKHVYKNRCRRCQRYTGFKKNYKGQRYLGFKNNRFPPAYSASTN